MAKGKEKSIVKKAMIGIGIFCVIVLMTAFQIIRYAYSKALEKQSEVTYQQFYQAAYDAAEKKNHTQNNANIIVEDIREEAKLEVLQVSGIEYIFHEEDASIWIAVRGRGVYTVDFARSEFIIDNERQYVLARIPKPQINTVDLDYEIEKYLFENGIFNGSTSEGVDLASTDLKRAQNQLQLKFASSQDYYEMAERSAEKLIKSLIANLNSELPGLVVEVEFID